MATNNEIFGGLHEQTANETIADWLSSQKREWVADGERVGVMQSGSGRPDIVIREGDRMPVIVETEYGSPAVSDAKSRLGKRLLKETRPFTEVIAVGISDECRQSTRESLTELLNSNAPIFTIQLVSQRDDAICVWPDAPLSTTPMDLVAYCEYAQIPQSVIESQTETIAERVRSAGGKLSDGLNRLPGGEAALRGLMNEVGCVASSTATRTACAIWIIAIDLQNDLAVHSSPFGAKGLKDTGSLGAITQAKLLESWEIVKSVNYLPVIELAISSLDAIPSRTEGLSDVLVELDELSDELNALHAKHIYNFAGELWQELVIDRKERAAFYTKPEVAELLAQLGAMRFAKRNVNDLASINLMDAACGTGTLIGAGERAIRRLYRERGGVNPTLHRNRMENHIFAMDINSIAGTLTAKRLTDLEVKQTYETSKIAVTDHESGSLSLLDPQSTGISEILGYRDVIQTVDGKGNLGLFHIGIGAEGEGVDWSLMNPPYNRARGGMRQATKGLAALRTKARRQGYAMSNGQAGLASDFGNLSLIRMNAGGVLSHVLPLTSAHAESWQDWRTGIETHFDNIIAIANVGRDEESMSADTGMNEMLLVATRRRANVGREWKPTSVLCVNLRAAPTTLSEGYALARSIATIPDGQTAGICDNFNFVRMTTPSPGFPWYGVGNANHEFAEVVDSLMRGDCYDPLRLENTRMDLDMATLQVVCGTGPTHHLIGHLSGRDPRGAFRWTEIEATDGAGSAQKSMWSADSKTQTRMQANPTHEGLAVDIDLARRMVAARGKWFLSRNLRWTSQALALAYTASENHGGSSWTALQDLPDATGACLALFYNSVFGAIMRQGYAQSTQPGRARIQVGAIGGLPCPDFGARTPEGHRARQVAALWFDSLKELELEPFAYCFRDESRHQIDSVVAEMLGLDHRSKDIQAMLARYRLLFASEPNVNGRSKRILRALESFDATG